MGSTTEKFATEFQLLRALVVEVGYRMHTHCDDSWYCCGKCRSLDHLLGPDEWLASHDGEAARRAGICSCGAEAHNARLADALAQLSKIEQTLLMLLPCTDHTGTVRS